VNAKMTLLFIAPLGLGLSACSSSSSHPPSDGGSDGQDATVSTPCPKSQPAQGAACSGASSCSYGAACSQTISVCTGGFWENSPAVLADGGECPATVPANGADCSLCASVGACSYNASCELDGGTRAVASCTSGHWSVTSMLCPVDGGISDGSSVDGADGAPDAEPEGGDARAEGGDAADGH
jgi:hypothetical protein